jgi:hypothetical protein
VALVPCAEVPVARKLILQKEQCHFYGPDKYGTDLAHGRTKLIGQKVGINKMSGGE